jgi:tripeptide aminopeptidase
MADKTHSAAGADRLLLDEKEIVDLFCQLAAVDAPSLQERAMANRVRQYLENLDLSVQEDQAGLAIGGNCGNLLCRIPGNTGELPLLFSTHLDTVQPCQDKKIIITQDRVIQTDGSTILGADDLAGVTAILC